MYIEHGHFSLGLGVASVALYLTYDMTWLYLKSLAPGGPKFVSNIHIYSRRFPSVSYTAILKLFGGVAALFFYLVINPYVGFDKAKWPHYENGEYKDCCRGLDHLNYSLTILLSGVADLLISCVKIPWPKGIDKFISGVFLFVIGSMLVEHSLFKKSPQEAAVHNIIAMLLITGACCLWLEIFANQSVVLNVARNIIALTLGTWLMQVGFTDKAGLRGQDEAIIKTYADSLNNKAFVDSTFICHILGNTSIIFLMYMCLSLRWRKMLTKCAADDTDGLINNNVKYSLLNTEDE